MPLRHLLTKQRFATLILSIFVCSSLSLLLFIGRSYATAYVTKSNSSGACASGEAKLDIKTYVSSGTTYDCVSWTNLATDIASTATTPCPKADAPAGNSPFGPFCVISTPVVKPAAVCRSTDPFSGQDPSSDKCTKSTDITTGDVNNDIKDITNFLAAGVGVIVTIMIVVGGIQYAASGGDPQAVANAKKKIYNALLALLAFALLYAFLQFIVPGGVAP